MKKKIIRAAASLAVAIVLFSGNVAYATENDNTQENTQEDLVIDLPDIAMEINIPDRYDIVFDRNRTYRGDLKKYGISASKATQSLIDINAHYHLFSFSDDNDGFEAYLVCDPEDKHTSITDLSKYDGSEILSIAFDYYSAFKEEGEKNGTTVTNDFTYTAKNNIRYICLALTEPEDDGTTSERYLMFTVVDGLAYYYSVAYFGNDKTAKDFRTYATELVDGVTYKNATVFVDSTPKTQPEKDLTESSDYASTEKEVEQRVNTPGHPWYEQEQTTSKADDITTHLIAKGIWILIASAFGAIVRFVKTH